MLQPSHLYSIPPISAVGIISNRYRLHGRSNRVLHPGRNPLRPRSDVPAVTSAFRWETHVPQKEGGGLNRALGRGASFVSFPILFRSHTGVQQGLVLNQGAWEMAMAVLHERGWPRLAMRLQLNLGAFHDIYGYPPQARAGRHISHRHLEPAHSPQSAVTWVAATLL